MPNRFCFAIISFEYLVDCLLSILSEKSFVIKNVVQNMSIKRKMVFNDSVKFYIRENNIFEKLMKASGFLGFLYCKGIGAACSALMLCYHFIFLMSSIFTSFRGISYSPLYSLFLITAFLICMS